MQDFGNFLDKEAEKLKITAASKFKISLMKKFGFARVTHSDTKPYFTVQRVKQNRSVTG